MLTYKVSIYQYSYRLVNIVNIIYWYISKQRVLRKNTPFTALI
nr:MAG TPA: hypothetical protein [Caudoviricetes sp.]